MIDESLIRNLVEKSVISILKQRGEICLSGKKVKINASNRHIHLTREHLDILFGVGFELVNVKDLVQPGEFASDQTVTIAGPKGILQKVRILGPVRKYTQIEISLTDSFVLGLGSPPLRDSGNLEGSLGVTLVGPKGTLVLDKGLILALRHVHMTPEDAALLGVKNGDFAKVRIRGERELVFEKVLMRVSPNYALEMHIDTDEANAAMIGPDTYGEIEIM